MGCRIESTGCAPNQSITQQIASQTDDPATVALATYGDALKLYVDAQNIYMPYQVEVESSNPEMGAVIIGYFSDARKILKAWKIFGIVPPGEKTEYKKLLGKTSIELAKYLEGRR